MPPGTVGADVQRLATRSVFSAANERPSYMLALNLRNACVPARRLIVFFSFSSRFNGCLRDVAFSLGGHPVISAPFGNNNDVASSDTFWLVLDSQTCVCLFLFCVCLIRSSLRLPLLFARRARAQCFSIGHVRYIVCTRINLTLGRHEDIVHSPYIYLQDIPSARHTSTHAKIPK